MQKKICSKCGEEKDLSEFYIQKTGKFGVTGSCKVCKDKQKNKWREDNPDYQKNYYKDNLEAQLDYQRQYRKANQEYLNQYRKLYHQKRNTDPQYRLSKNLRCRIYHALHSQNASRNTRSSELLGCSISELKQHLESQFTDGMTWANHCEWHIDHIKPCASFDLTDPEQQKQCFHFTNLQPLWAEDNLRKSDKVA